MHSVLQKAKTVSKQQLAKRHPTQSKFIVRSSTKPNTSFNDFVEKRKEVDKLRIERIKEIGNTLDHVAKSEIKQTVEIMSEVMPFIKKIKGVEKIFGTDAETTVEKAKEE